MEFNYYTILFQIVNFLVLVVILKKLLFGRIVNAMDERERNIRNRIDKAEDSKREAEQEAERQKNVTAEIRDSRQQKLDRAEEEAKSRRDELTQKARRDAEEAKREWLESLETEKKDFMETLRERSSRAICDIAQKALRDLADAALEEQMANVFVHRLKELSDEDREAIAEQLSREGDIIVRHRFELPKKHKDAITKEMHDSFGKEVNVSYEQSEGVGCGLEANVAGNRIGWSVDTYLRGLREQVENTFDEKRQAHEEPESKESSQGQEEEAHESADKG